MGYGESDTRFKLIDPVLYQRGWTEENIRREESAGAIQVIESVPRKKTKGRTDYTLRVKVRRDTQPVAVAIIDAKAEDLPPRTEQKRIAGLLSEHIAQVEQLQQSLGSQLSALDHLPFALLGQAFAGEA